MVLEKIYFCGIIVICTKIFSYNSLNFSSSMSKKPKIDSSLNLSIYCSEFFIMFSPP